MTTAYTSLLGLALPVTGELSGTWGDTVNDSITSLLDTAVAGTTNVSADSNVTLTTTTGASNQARQAILLFSGARTAIRTVTAPAQSKVYTVINATTGGFAVTLVGAGPTTGLTIPNGASATVAWNGSDFVEIGASRIGNLTVNGTLTVTGVSIFSAGSAAAPAITTTGDTNTGIFFPAADTIAFAEGGAEAMRLDSSGNMGVGTTSPATRLHVLDSLSGGQFIVANSQTNSSGKYGTFATQHYTNAEEPALCIAVESASNANNVLIGGALGEFNAATSIQFYTAANNTTTGGSERMRLDASGRLGLGTTSPAQRLELRTDTTTSGSEPNIFLNNRVFGNTAYYSGGIFGGGYRDTSDPTYIAGIDFYRTTSFDGYASAGSIIFYTDSAGQSSLPNLRSGSEAMRIDPSKNLLVGTTSVTLGALGNFVKSNSTNYMMYVENSANTSGDKTFRSVLGSNCNNTSSFHFVANTGSNDKLYIFGNGNVVNANNSYGSLSDVKLKENIVDATPKLAGLMQVKVRNYNMIGDTTKQIGVVAQELETVFPSMVDETPDMDAEGNDLGTTTKSVKYSVFVPILIKAIQEQQAIIESLKTRITALEGQ